jgi:hypothetical protein
MSLSSDQRKQADAHITDLRARAVANAVAKAGPSSLTTNRLAQQAADTFDKVWKARREQNPETKV